MSVWSRKECRSSCKYCVNIVWPSRHMAMEESGWMGGGGGGGGGTLSDVEGGDANDAQ